MLKNVYFLEKKFKIASASGAPFSNPRCLHPSAGGSATRPRIVTPLLLLLRLCRVHF